MTAVFTLEYLLRIATWPNPLHYIFSFWGLLTWRYPAAIRDVGCGRKLASIMSFAAGNAGDPRVAYSQTVAFMPSLNVFWRAIVSARHQLILFYSFIAIVMVIFGSLMYLIEGPEYGFTTLNFRSIGPL